VKNLAGIPTDDANAAIIDELASAGVDAVLRARFGGAPGARRRRPPTRVRR